MRKRGRPPKTTINFSTAEISAPITPEEISQNENENFAENKTLSYREKDGKIAWDSMRQSTRENLREFYLRPDVQSELGITEKLAEEKPEFGDEEASALLDFLQPVLSIGSSKVYKVPIEITTQAYVFDESMRKKLNPRLSRLLNKWGPSVFKQYKDEIGFSLVMLSCVAAQTKHMKILHEKSKRAKVTPIAPPKTEEKTPPEMTATGD